MPLIHFYNFKKDQNYTANGSIVYDKVGNSHYSFLGEFGTSSDIGSTTYGVANSNVPFNHLISSSVSIPPIGEISFLPSASPTASFSVLFRFKLESIAYEKEIITLRSVQDTSNSSISVMFDPATKLLGMKIGFEKTKIIYNSDNPITIKANSWYFVHLIIRPGFYTTVLLNNQILTPFIQSAPYLKKVNAYGAFNANWKINSVDTSKVYLSELAFFNETISNDTQQNYYLNGIVVPDPQLTNTDTGGRKYVDYNNPVYYFTFNQNINYNTVGGGVTETVSSGITTRTYGFAGPGVSTIAGFNVSAVAARLTVETKSPATYVNKPFAKGSPQIVSGLNSGTNNALLVGENIGNKFASEIPGYNLANFTSTAKCYDLVGTGAMPYFSYGVYADSDVTISFSYRKLTDAQSTINDYDVKIGLLLFNEFEGNFYWKIQNNSTFLNIALGSITTVKNPYAWNNFCFVINTSKEKCYIYVNGVLVDIFFHGPFNSTSSIKNPSIILGGAGIRLFAIDDIRLYQSALTANDAKMLLPTTSYIGSGIVPIGDTAIAGDSKSSAKLKLPVVPATQPNTPPANPSGIIYQRPNFSVTYPLTHDPANIPFDNNGILARYLLDFFVTVLVTVQQIKYYFPYYATKYPDYIENFKKPNDYKALRVFDSNIFQATDASKANIYPIRNDCVYPGSGTLPGLGSLNSLLIGSGIYNHPTFGMEFIRSYGATVPMPYEYPYNYSPPKTNWSLSFWIKRVQIGGEGINYGNSTWITIDYICEIRPDAKMVPGTIQMILRLYWVTGGYEEYVIGPVPTIFTSFIITGDTGNNNEVKLYVNGVLTKTFLTTVITNVGPVYSEFVKNNYTSPKSVILGVKSSSAPTGILPPVVAIQDLGLFSYALAPHQINQIYSQFVVNKFSNFGNGSISVNASHRASVAVSINVAIVPPEKQKPYYLFDFNNIQITDSFIPPNISVGAGIYSVETYLFVVNNSNINNLLPSLKSGAAANIITGKIYEGRSGGADLSLLIGGPDPNTTKTLKMMPRIPRNSIFPSVYNFYTSIASLDDYYYNFRIYGSPSIFLADWQDWEVTIDYDKWWISIESQTDNNARCNFPYTNYNGRILKSKSLQRLSSPLPDDYYPGQKFAKSTPSNELPWAFGFYYKRVPSYSSMVVQGGLNVEAPYYDNISNAFTRQKTYYFTLSHASGPDQLGYSTYKARIYYKTYTREWVTKTLDWTGSCPDNYTGTRNKTYYYPNQRVLQNNYLNNNRSIYSEYTVTLRIDDNQWHNICFAKHNGSGISLYVDGLLKTTLLYPDAEYNARDIYIDSTAQCYFVDFSGSEQFAIDDIQFFNGLTPAEVARVFANNEYYYGIGKCELNGTAAASFRNNSRIGSGRIQLIANAVAGLNVYSFKGSGVFQVLANALARTPYQYPIHKYRFDEAAQSENSNRLSDDVGDNDFTTVIDVVNEENVFFRNAKIGTGLLLGSKFRKLELAGKKWLVYGQIKDIDWTGITAFTISFYIKNDTNTPYNGFYPDTSYQGSWLKMYNAGQKSTTLSLELGNETRFWQTNNQFKGSTFAVDNVNWSFYTITYDSNFTLNKIKVGKYNVYVNGSLIANFSGDPSSFRSPFNSIIEFGYGDTTEPPPMRFLLDDLRIYASVLSQKQIVDLYISKHGPLICYGSAQLSGAASYFVGGREKGIGQFEMAGTTEVYNTKQFVFSRIEMQISSVDTEVFFNKYYFEGTGTFECTVSAESYLATYAATGSGVYQIVASTSAKIKQWRYPASFNFELTGTAGTEVVYGTEFIYPLHAFTFNNPQVDPTNSSKIYFTDKLSSQKFQIEIKSEKSNKDMYGQNVPYSIDFNTAGKFTNNAITVGSLSVPRFQYSGTPSNRYQRYDKYFTSVGSIDKNLSQLINGSLNWTISFWVKKNTISIPASVQSTAFPISSYLCNGHELDVPAVFRVKRDSGFQSYENWTHICYVFNVALLKDSRNYISYYVNGVAQPTIPYQNITNIIQDFITFGTDTPQNAASFVDTNGTTQTITKNFGPQPYAIDDIRFYNKPLSTINIQRIINSVYIIAASASQIGLSGSINVVVLPNSFTGSGAFQVVANSKAAKSVFQFEGSGLLQASASHKFKVPYSYPVNKFVFEDLNSGNLLVDSAGEASTIYTVTSIVNGESPSTVGKTGTAFYFGTTGTYDSFNILEYNISASIVNLTGGFDKFAISFWLYGIQLTNASYNSSNPIIEIISDSVKSVTFSDEGGGRIYFWYVLGDSFNYLTHFSLPNTQNYSLITLTYDDTVLYGQDNSQIGEWKVYFDAVLVNTIRTTESNSYFISPNSSSPVINLSSPTAPSKRRAIDDLRLYNKVLFDYEILDIYNFKYGPIFGESKTITLIGTAPAKLSSKINGSGTFELLGTSDQFINVYEHIATGKFEITGNASYYSSYYEYLASGSFENLGESGYYASNYGYSGSGQFENIGSAQAAQNRFGFDGSGSLQVIADAIQDFNLSLASDIKFELIGSYDHYVIYKYITQGSFETYGAAVEKMKLSFAATGSIQVTADYSYDPIYGSLWERTSHYYHFNKNMFDGRGNFNILFNGTYANDSVIGKYGIGAGVYPFDALGSEDNAFFSGERFALTFRFLITDTFYDKVLITLNSNDAVATVVEPSITIVFEAEDKKLHFGFGGDLLSNITITSGIWYFVSLYKRKEIIYTSINAGTLSEELYDYSTVNFNGIQSQNLENGFDITPLYYSDIRFYNDMITPTEITYLYNNGVPTVLSPVDVAYEYQFPDHKYEFLLSERISSCCYDLADSSGDATITLDVPQLSFEPFIDGLDGDAIRIGKNYLNQGGLYTYEAYGYAYDDFVGTESYSVTFWHKMLGPSVGAIDPTNSLPFSETLAVTTSTGEVIFSIRESNGELRFYLENTFLEDDEYLLASGSEIQRWNHIGFVCDAIQGRAYIYFNSNLVKAISYSRVLTDAAALFLGYNSYANNFKLGVMSVASQSYSELQAIEQLLFFTLPLTAWDISTIYGCGVDANVELKLVLPFNAGTLPTYTYRFEASCGAYDDQNKIVPAQTLGESCSAAIQTFVNVGSDTITNACLQLLDAGYDFELTSVKRWSKPTVFEAGPFQDGVFEDITNYCSDPACFQFCVNYRVNVAVTAIMLAITDKDEILGSGLFNLDGTAGIRFSKFTTTGNGLFELYGDAQASQIGGSEGQYYTGSGSFESFGLADYDSSDKGILNTDISADITVISLQPFVVATSGATLVGSQGSSSVSQCGCISIPYETAFSHNLTKESEFTKFIKRNNFTIPPKIIFYYNDKISKYVGNLKYNGLSTTSNNLEKWEIVFELACTGYYNEFSKLYDWNFSISFKKTPNNSNSIDTKVVLLFKSSNICPLNGASFDFRADANLSTKLLTVNGNTFLVNSVIVNDRIGLFKSVAWTSDPVLSLQVGTPL